MTFMIHNSGGNDERVRYIRRYLLDAISNIQRARAEILAMGMQDADQRTTDCPFSDELLMMTGELSNIRLKLFETFVVTPYCAPPSDACLRYCELTERPTLEAYKLCTEQNNDGTTSR